MVTLVAAVCVIITTKTLSHTIFLPRPAIESRKIYQLQGDQLVLMKLIGPGTRRMVTSNSLADSTTR